MATGQGYASRCGIEIESSWGTAAAVASVMPFTSEGINRSIAKIEAMYLDGNAGKKALYNSVVSALGDLSGEIPLNYLHTRGLEYLLWAFAGGNGSDGGGSGYLQYKLSNTVGNSLTLAFNKSVSCWEISGAKVNTLEVSGNAGEAVKFTANMIARNILRTGDAGITNTISGVNALSALGDPDLAMFDDLVFRIGDQANALGSGDQYAISSFSISMNNNLSEPTFPTVTSSRTNSLLTIEPLRNGFREITFNITIPRYESDQFFSWLNADTALQADFKITTASSHILNFLFPNIRITEVTAPIGGPELNTLSISCTAIRNNGTNTYMTYEDTDAIAEELGLEIDNGASHYIGYVVP